MLRIHFEPADLARTTVASSGDVLWETLMSLHTLQERAERPPFASWHRRVRPLIPRSLHPLFEMAPPRGYSADFLTPTRGLGDLDESVEELRRTPASWMRHDFTMLAEQRRTPFVAYASSLNSTALVKQLAGALKNVFDIAVGPYWTQVSRDIEADGARFARTLSGQGVERLLETLGPRVRWRSPVLEIDRYVEQDLHLRGRGLVLVPSFFCRLHPVTLLDSDRPPVLILPVTRRHPLLTEPGTEPADGPLEALLGRTRTIVLWTSTRGCSTTDIARAADITPASASHHTKVLRQAGLITTERDGHHVCHRITDLGRALLDRAPYRAIAAETTTTPTSDVGAVETPEASQTP